MTMTEQSLLDLVLQQVGATLGLVLVLWFMQQNHKAYMDRERENANIHREDKLKLLATLDANTDAKARLIQSVIHLETLLVNLTSKVIGEEK